MVAEHCLLKLVEERRRSQGSRKRLTSQAKGRQMSAIIEAVSKCGVLEPYQLERFNFLLTLYTPGQDAGFNRLVEWALEADGNFAQLQLLPWVMGSFKLPDSPSPRRLDRHTQFLRLFFEKVGEMAHADPRLRRKAMAILQYQVQALIEKSLESTHDQPMQARLQKQLADLFVCERAFLEEGMPSQLTAWINEQKTDAHTWAKAHKPSLFRSFLIALVRLVRVILFYMGLVGSIKTTGGKLWHSNMKYHLSVLKGKARGEALFARFLLPSLVLDNQWSPEVADELLPFAARAEYQQCPDNEALAAFDAAPAAP